MNPWLDSNVSLLVQVQNYRNVNTWQAIKSNIAAANSVRLGAAQNHGCANVQSIDSTIFSRMLASTQLHIWPKLSVIHIHSETP